MLLKRFFDFCSYLYITKSILGLVLKKTKLEFKSKQPKTQIQKIQNPSIKTTSPSLEYQTQTQSPNKTQKLKPPILWNYILF